MVPLLLFGVLWASLAEYHITALGVSMSYISINRLEKDKVVEVKSHSLKANKLFPQLNNFYKIQYDAMLRPLTTLRLIRQKNYADEIRTDYDHNTLSAKMFRLSDQSSSTYHIATNSRDVFSFLLFLSTGKALAGAYRIDGNGLPWQARVQRGELEVVKTKIGKLSARRYDIRFVNLSGQKMPYTDMVTHNMLKEDNKLSLWITDQQLVAKALVKKGAMSVNWELIGVTP